MEPIVVLRPLAGRQQLGCLRAKINGRQPLESLVCYWSLGRRVELRIAYEGKDVQTTVAGKDKLPSVVWKRSQSYRAHREIDQALENGDSLDAAKRVADDCRLRINNDDFSTRPLLVKAVELRRADVIQFLVERGADLDHVWDPPNPNNIESSLLWAAIQSGRYSDAVFLLDVGAAVNGRESYARDRTPLMRAAQLASISWVPHAPERLAMVRLLLSRGANFDAVDTYGHKVDQIAGEEELSSYPNPNHTAVCALLADVRAAGGWRGYARRCFKSYHRDRLEMLVLRVLCERGRATTDDALLSRLFPSVEDAAADAPARRLDPVDRDAFRHVFSFWPPPSRVLGAPAEEHPLNALGCG